LVPNSSYKERPHPFPPFWTIFLFCFSLLLLGALLLPHRSPQVLFLASLTSDSCRPFSPGGPGWLSLVIGAPALSPPCSTTGDDLSFLTFSQFPFYLVISGFSSFAFLTTDSAWDTRGDVFRRAESTSPHFCAHFGVHPPPFVGFRRSFNGLPPATFFGLSPGSFSAFYSIKQSPPFFLFSFVVYRGSSFFLLPFHVKEFLGGLTFSPRRV